KDAEAWVGLYRLREACRCVVVAPEAKPHGAQGFITFVAQGIEGTEAQRPVRIVFGEHRVATPRMDVRAPIERGGAGAVQRQRAEIEVIGAEILWALAPRALDFRAANARFDDPDDGLGDLVLEVEDVFQDAVIFVGPNVRAGLSLDELSRDAQAIAAFAQAALEHVANAELAPDLLDVDDLALVGEARIPRDHEQPIDPRQAGDDILDHAVGEILLLGIAAHVLERQHRDRRLVGEWYPEVRRFRGVFQVDAI